MSKSVPLAVLLGSWVSLVSAQTPTPTATPTPPPQDVTAASDAYRLQILGVDASRFPRIRVEFQVFTEDIDTPPWTPGSGFAIQEAIVGKELTPVVDMGPVEVCGTSRVIMAIAVDTSCSVQPVIEDMRTGVVGLLSQMKGVATSKDAAGFFGFDTPGVIRQPAIGATPEYSTDLAALAADIADPVKTDMGPPCSGSPIWWGMLGELDRLVKFEPAETSWKRALVTFADGKDNRMKQVEWPPGSGIKVQTKEALIRLANEKDVTLVNLGYGRVRRSGMNEIAEATGGAFLNGADENLAEALRRTYQTLREIWCVEYTTPFPDAVNTPATVVISGGGVRGTDFYPMPFLVPEDTARVELEFPLSFKTFGRLTAGGEMPGVRVSLRLVDAAGAPHDDGRPPVPSRAFEATVDVPADQAFARLDPGVKALVDELLALETKVADQLTDAEEARKAELLARLAEARLAFFVPVDRQDLLGIPTGHVDLGRTVTGGQLIEGVSHFELEAAYYYGGTFDPNSARRYMARPRLSIQDRTPPHVQVRLKPQDGGLDYGLTVVEAPADLDPVLLPAAPLPDPVSVKVPGAGAKRAGVRYAWRGLDGAALAGTVEAQPWAVPGPDGKPAHGLDDGGAGLFATGGGVRLDVGARAAVEVLARDNHALLEGLAIPAEAGVFTDPVDPEKGPVHARFDPNRAEALGYAPPFLPRRTRAELEADPALPGVTWWVASLDPRDTGRDKDHVADFSFPISDTDAIVAMANGGQPPPPGVPLRTLEVLARDQAGNVTRLTIPLSVEDADFKLQQIQSETQRSR